MKKLIKKYVLTAIVINLLAIVYGTTLNFVLHGENTSILFSYVQGLLVGVLVVAIYLLVTFIFGYCSYSNPIRTFINTVAMLLTWFGITILIGNIGWIPLDYAWMYIANLFFVGLVVGKANYDGYNLR